MKVKTSNGKYMEINSVVPKDVTITVGFLGKSTVAVASINGTEGIGLALCMPTDKYSKDIGTGIAVARAIRHIADNMEEAWVGRAVTKAEWKEKHKKG